MVSRLSAEWSSHGQQFAQHIIRMVSIWSAHDHQNDQLKSRMLTCHNLSRSAIWSEWSAYNQHMIRMISIWSEWSAYDQHIIIRMVSLRTECSAVTTRRGLPKASIWSEWSAYDHYIIRAYDRHIDQHMISILISIWSEWWGMWRRRGNEPLVTSQRWVVFMGKYV